jgi:hypothetical protein
MPGRAAILHSHLLTTASSDDTSMGQHTPSADVLWKCATISLYASTFQAETTQANPDGGVVQVRVNASAIFAAWLSGQVAQSRHAFSLVVPWGDGLRFTAGEAIDWYLATPWGLSGFVNAGFLGTFEPEA